MKWLLVVMVAVVLALHQDWLRTDAGVLFGFLPVGLAYHLAYCLLASVMMWVLVRYAWPAHLEEAEPVPAVDPRAPREIH